MNYRHHKRDRSRERHGYRGRSESTDVPVANSVGEEETAQPPSPPPQLPRYSATDANPETRQVTLLVTQVQRGSGCAGVQEGGRAEQPRAERGRD
jgi:hypothetical protein